MDELGALVALAMVEGLGPVTVRRLVRAFGSAAATLAAGAGELARVEGIG